MPEAAAAPRPGPYEPRRAQYDVARLLAVAVEVFIERGYDGTSMEDLARATGISKSSIYHHVESKEQLLRLALERALDALFAITSEEGAKTARAIDRLQYVIGRVVEVLGAELPYVTVLLRVRGNTETERWALERRRQFDRFVRAIVIEAAADGGVREDPAPRSRRAARPRDDQLDHRVVPAGPGRSGRAQGDGRGDGDGGAGRDAMIFDAVFEQMSAADRSVLQEQRWRRLTERLESHPFHQGRLGTATPLEELASLPLTTKQDLWESYPFGLLAVDRSELRRVHATSGTRGRPTVAAYTAGDLEIFRHVNARALAAAGAKAGTVVHNAYGYGLFTGGLGLHGGAELLGCAVVPISGGQTARQVVLVRDFRGRGALLHPELRRPPR